MGDSLIIGYDTSKETDHARLIVLRKTSEKIYVLNQFLDNEARKVYNELIGVIDNGT